MGIIDYYEGDNDKNDIEKARMKALSAKWHTHLRAPAAKVGIVAVADI